MDMADMAFIDLRRYTRALSMALGLRDPSTLMHSDRVQGLSREIGTRCGLGSESMGILEIAASFHDVGKIGIRDAVLMKPAQLDEDEWELMRQHCEMGEQIIAATGLDGAAEAARIIRHHHEHYDGSGYPDRLAGYAIPLLSRIISIADAYDAMAVTRSYHRARAHESILEVLDRETGRKYDPELMDVFRDVIATSAYRIAGDTVPPAAG